MKNIKKLLIILLFFQIGCSNIKNNDAFDKQRLTLIDKLINESIDNKTIPGAVVLVADNQNVVFHKAYGIKNPLTNEAFKVDDIFRIASMTKAITSLGVIKLWEKGKIGLDDPVSNYIPEFKDAKVLDTYNDEDTTYTTTLPSKKITIRHLLTHTSGIGYGFIDGNPSIKAIYHKEKQSFMKNGVLCFCDEDISIGETITKLSNVPLHHSPGERFTYGIGLDVLGYLIEIVSGKTLDVYFNDEIFEPLEMYDTYFYLPENKYDRLVPVLTKENDKWVIFEDDRFNINYPIEGSKRFFAGGCGLSSTLKDYYNFLSIFINDGKFKENQIISKMTNALLFQNQLPKSFNQGVGLAFGLTREEDLYKGSVGSINTLSWGGYFNTQYFADPEKKIVGIIYKQTQNIQDNTSDLFKRSVFNSLVN